MCSSHWRQAADLIIEPDVNGFEYDAFVHTTALIKAGETAARAAVPTLKKWMEADQPLGKMRAARALVQAATMPAD
jgi:predicted acylesterase/phospholipase RssA